MMKWTKHNPDFGTETVYISENHRVKLVRMLQDGITWYHIIANGRIYNTVRTLKEAKIIGEELS